MNFKFEFKPACKKAWQAFNTWRKRGMWFRVTVLVIIGFSMNFERLYTTNHVPLINELVWIACRAIRYGSEPKVPSAYLRYFHAQKSRRLQNELRTEFQAGRLSLDANEIKLLHQNTINANYNKLFELAKRRKLIPANITLSQTKRAMFAKARKLTAERFDPEWADVKKMVLTVPPLSLKQLLLNLRWLGYSLLVVLPLPVIPGLPWFILCLTLGFWGARSKYKTKWILAVFGAVSMTLLWLYVANHGERGWFNKWYWWNTVGINIFLIIWAVIGSIMGRRLYKYASKYSKETQVFICLLVIVSAILLMPVTCFRGCYMRWNWWGMWCAGRYLFFRSSAFAPYFATIGLAALGYTYFLIYKNYAERLKKSRYFLAVQCLLITFAAWKLIYWWVIFSK